MTWNRMLWLLKNIALAGKLQLYETLLIKTRRPSLNRQDEEFSGILKLFNN